ncbi:glutaminyl-peptide cyclotransferase [Euryarchaeota archaeon]|nr:glutaminyl-peptide cyclotransferase [Euryarchaeota archaeon]MDC3310240.1 glutaminyl-peptide cyclotransferase [Candidatus Poseidoniales archaeon]
MIRRGGGIKSVSILILVFFFSTFSPLVQSDMPSYQDTYHVEIIEPEIVEIIPHDSHAFTQGLLIHNGKIYESTGLYGESSLRIVNMSTGQIEKIVNLTDEYFAEGIAIINNSLIQLTWKENIGILYNYSSLEVIGNFTYEGEGWGLCSTENNNLWFSDGSFQISKISPENLSISNDLLTVKYNNSPINRLNELECPFENSLIYANIWLEDRIVSISQSTGDVCFEYDFTNIRLEYENDNSRELNGIAYDESSSHFLITGKNWSNYYLVDFNSSFQDCQIIEEPVVENNFSYLQYVVIFAVAIFLMPFSWPTFVLVFYKLLRRQTQQPPPSRTVEKGREG